jgi:hypothetical protein
MDPTWTQQGGGIRSHLAEVCGNKDSQKDKERQAFMPG